MALRADVQAWTREIERRYAARRPRSAELHARARYALPGGDTRFSSALFPFSTYFESASGQQLQDVDGHTYVDLTNNNTALVHGHSHPAITEAVARQLGRGTAWVGPNPVQLELAELLVERVPSLERLRFTNSGSEATAMMVKVARAYTGRDLIMKMDAFYHGCGDLFEFGPSADDPTRPAPLMAGLPRNLADNLVIGRFNDTPGVLELIERHREALAAVILTPVSSAGLVEPVPGFLQAVREATARHGILLLFDEVITLRLSPGGGQLRYGVTPDMTAVGKIIGGGFPVGGFGGRADIMAVTDPEGAIRVNHAGTYNGNPITMTAGRESLRLLTREAFEHLDGLGARLESGLRAAVTSTRAPMHVARVGSLLWLDVAPPAGATEFAEVAPAIRRTLRNAYLDNGVQALGLNTTTVMTETDVDRGIEGIRLALDELMSYVGVGVA